MMCMDYLHIISIGVARERGFRHYLTGEPCSRGHYSLRNTKNKQCIACHRDRQAKARAEPGFKEKRAAYDRERWLNDRDYLVSKNKSYYAKNADAVNAQKREYWANNKDKMHEARDLWRANNMARILHLNALRKRQIKMATPPWADKSAILNVYEEAERLTEQTGVVHHVDHVIPLKGDLVCGLHVHNNLQPLPWVENIKKKNKFDVES